MSIYLQAISCWFQDNVCTRVYTGNNVLFQFRVYIVQQKQHIHKAEKYTDSFNIHEQALENILYVSAK